MAAKVVVPQLHESALETSKPAYWEKKYSAEDLAEHRALIDRVLDEGGKRIRRSVERLEAMGFYDKDGNRLKKELPPDMLPGADRDFGG